MTPTGVDIVLDFLTHAFDPSTLVDTVERLVDPAATYVSLAFDDPDLNRFMPWAGTKHGSQAFVDNVRGITTRWNNEAVEVRSQRADALSAVELHGLPDRPGGERVGGVPHGEGPTVAVDRFAEAVERAPDAGRTVRPSKQPPRLLPCQYVRTRAR